MVTAPLVAPITLIELSLVVMRSCDVMSRIVVTDEGVSSLSVNLMDITLLRSKYCSTPVFPVTTMSPPLNVTLVTSSRLHEANAPPLGSKNVMLDWA